MVAGLRENGESENSGWVGLRDAGMLFFILREETLKRYLLDTGTFDLM
jgi:hypothetical protein